MNSNPPGLSCTRQNGLRHKEPKLKITLLRETDLTLTKAVDICRAAAVSRKQVKALGDKSPENVYALRKYG